MTDDALRKLRDAVKAGTIHRDAPLSVWFPMESGRSDFARWAYLGDIDAARLVHEKLLPDHFWELRRILDHRPDGSSVPMFACDVTGVDTVYHENAGRAWLLAILEALIAQQGAGKGGE